MTEKEFHLFLNKKFGFTDWPEQYEIDAETYAHVCQRIFDIWVERDFPPQIAEVHLGKNGGIIYKNMELILKGRQL